MLRRMLSLALVVIVTAATVVAAGRIKQYGRAVVEYRDDDVLSHAKAKAELPITLR